VRPHRSESDEEAHRPPRGKRATWSGNQLTPLSEKQQSIAKAAFDLKKMGYSGKFY